MQLEFLKGTTGGGTTVIKTAQNCFWPLVSFEMASNNIKMNFGHSQACSPLIHGELKDSEINQIYNHPKVKTMISLTKGEGFGRPLLEFSAVGKPIIASGWSGHIDFLRSDLNLLVGGELTPVHQSAVMKDMILKDSKWFSASKEEARKAYKEVFKHYKKYLRNAKRQAMVTKKYYTLEKMEEKLTDLLLKYVPNFPTELDFIAPEPKVIEIPKRPKNK